MFREKEQIDRKVMKTPEVKKIVTTPENIATLQMEDEFANSLEKLNENTALGYMKEGYATKNEDIKDITP